MKPKAYLTGTLVRQILDDILESQRPRMTEGIYLGQGRCTNETATHLFVKFTSPTRTKRWISKARLHPTSKVLELGDEGELVVDRWFIQES